MRQSSELHFSNYLALASIYFVFICHVFFVVVVWFLYLFCSILIFVWQTLWNVKRSSFSWILKLLLLLLLLVVVFSFFAFLWPPKRYSRGKIVTASTFCGVSFDNAVQQRLYDLVKFTAYFPDYPILVFLFKYSWFLFVELLTTFFGWPRCYFSMCVCVCVSLSSVLLLFHFPNFSHCSKRTN